MNELEHHELLSAWLDGETTPEEAARVEQWLASSPEARRVADEMRQVSVMLRTLPVEPAPAELAAAVRQQAERETLLPVAASMARTPPRRGRGWWMIVSGLVASAAGLLLMVYALSDDGEPRTPQVADLSPAAGPESAASFAAGESGDSVAPVAMRASSPERQEIVTGTLLREPEAPLEEDRRPDRQSLGMAESGAPQLPGSNAAVARHNRDRAFRFEKEDATSESRALRNVRIGDVLPYFAATGDRVAVVEVTVVDVRQAVGTMQVLLSMNAVPKRKAGSDAEAAGLPESPEPNAERRGGEPQAAGDSHGLTALYVETTESQLASALGQFHDDELFVDLRLQPPVTLDEIEGSQTSMAVADRRAATKDSEADDEMRARVADAVVRSQRGARGLSTLNERRTASPESLAAAAAQVARSPRPEPRNTAARKKTSDEAAAGARPLAATTPKDNHPAAKPGDPNRESAGLMADGGTGRSRQSFQLLVNVPAETAEADREQADAAPADSAAGAPAAEAAPLVANTRGAKEIDEATPLRVILIFQSAEARKAGG